MRLHENKELFQDAVIATAQQKGIREIYIEKDYWITFALYQIFKSEIGKETVFKGGTALSKCFDLIQRFSEDIDLVVLRNENETGNQLKTKIKKIFKCVSDVLPEIEIDGITNKVGMIRKTAHNYKKIFTGHLGQVRDIIIVEST
jgi:predicted nucleotidyltransferase component of viral defense system